MTDPTGPGLPPAQPRHLDAVVESLFGPILKPGSLPAGWDVVTWEAEQGLSLTLRRNRSIMVLELERRDESRPCHTRTRYFNITIWWPFGDSRELDAGGREVVETVIRQVRTWEATAEMPDRIAVSRPTLIRQILVDRVLMPEGRGQYYINPYVGCMIGCDFCYVMDRADWSRELEGLPALPWGRWVDAKVNAAEVLAREIMQYPPGPVRFSPILTDPYQPVERRFRVTRQCLEVLVDTGFVPLILTRAERVLEDVDLFKRFPQAAVGFSIPSDDDRMRAIFEPGSDPIDARFHALEVLKDAGITTFVVVQPMLPMDPERLVERLAPLVKAARIDRMNDLFRVEHLYRQHGLEYAMTDEFADGMQRRLVDGFRARGVSLDEMDDMAPLTTE
jgi:DNA repair photolyase